MNHVSTNLNDAIVRFTGYGKAIHPMENKELVAEIFSSKEWPQILERLDSIIGELNQLKPDWSSCSLAQAGKWAKAEMKSKHPELNEDALNALEWTFTWWWR